MPLYTTEQRRKRDASPWTVVQAVLAPVQFLVFVVSAALVVAMVREDLVVIVEVKRVRIAPR